MPLNVIVDREGDRARIRLEGQLDAHAEPELESMIEAMRESTPRAVIVEMSKLESVSPAGLRCLTRLHEIVQSSGGRMRITDPTPRVRKALETANALPMETVLGSDELEDDELGSFFERLQRQRDA